jgi:stage V sporulation protein T
MKETGIVRKLDNLGRLVIPKEIRRCMRIKEGSPIEFGLLPSGEIVLCKYSLINQVSDYSEEFCRMNFSGGLSINGFTPIKKSCILKIALAFGLEVLK